MAQISRGFFPGTFRLFSVWPDLRHQRKSPAKGAFTTPLNPRKMPPHAEKYYPSNIMKEALP